MSYLRLTNVSLDYPLYGIRGHDLRKALVKAGYPQIPVASLNFSGLEKDSGFQMTLPLARKCIACIFYGDMLCALRNQVADLFRHRH